VTWMRLLVAELPLIGQRNCAGVPVEQANAQLLFEAGNSAADTRGCASGRAAPGNCLHQSQTLRRRSGGAMRDSSRYSPPGNLQARG
jgi:hypothetical protein